MSVALSRPTPPAPLKIRSVRLAVDADSPVPSPVGAQLARLESRLSAQAESRHEKYPRQVRAMTLIGGAAASWGLVIAAVTMAAHLIARG